MTEHIQDSWESGDPYEYFMGRWSRKVGELFLQWLKPSENIKWLDVGCGSGALSEEILKNYKPSLLSAVDQSEGFIKSIHDRLGNKGIFKVGDALDLPVENGSIDLVVSGLVLNFIPEALKAILEMKRVTVSGGTVAVYIWDYPDQMEFLNYFWDCALTLDENASILHEGKRFPDATAENLRMLFEESNFVEIENTAITAETNFINFEDYWNPFLGGQGPAPSYLQSLSDLKRDELKELLMKELPIQSDGTIPLVARAWAIKGKV